MTRLGSDSFVRVRAAYTPDPRTGTMKRDWENATELTITRVMVEPFPMAEKLNFEDDSNREFGRTAYRFYCPPTTDILYTDRILWNGLRLKVFGHPGPWKRFNGRLHHVVFIARVEEG